MINSRLLLFLLLYIPLSLMGQEEGCTDAAAVNYNPDATINDGSCVYPNLNIKPAVVIRKLPSEIFETSGLLWWNGGYWTHNDSGGLNVIYKIDSLTGKIKQRITVANASHVDWEEIDMDADYIYIGDFGNNLGVRNDLVIYKIRKTDIPEVPEGEVIAELIHYNYGDQSEFVVRNRNNDFDCESMICFGDSIYLFSKNWATQTSKLYSLPKVPGTYTIFPLDEFNVRGLITGASYDSHENMVALIGYANYIPFVWVLYDFPRNDFFGGNKRRIDFKELISRQTEGITIKGSKTFMISAERTKVARAKIYRLDLNGIL